MIDLINEAYPKGYENTVKMHVPGSGKHFQAFPLSTNHCNYLAKIDLGYEIDFEESDEDETPEFLVAIKKNRFL